MKITHVRIRNYRSLRDLSLRVDDYTALIGTNGAGKSSILYALDWFFNGSDPDENDRHVPSPAKPAQPPEHYEHADAGDHDEDDDEKEAKEDSAIDVEVTFSDLTALDRAELGMYGRGTVARLRRICDPPQKGKLIGTSRQGPGFAAIRQMTPIGERRKAFAQKVEELDGLDAATTKDDIEVAMLRWEDNPSNHPLLEDVDPDESSHMFGFDGERALRNCIRFVLVPASSDIPGELGSRQKGSALNRLLGAVLTGAVDEAQRAWEATYQAEIQTLKSGMEAGVASATAAHTQRINARLSELLPDATVNFTPQMPSFGVSGAAGLDTSVEIKGVEHDVARQGHGVQRAVLMAVLQAFAPAAPASGTTGAAALGASSVDPALVVAIEEPEIYQHPVRARHFGRSLTRLSTVPGTQVLLATHSPYFIRPEQFAGLRRIELRDGHSAVVSTTLTAVAQAAQTVIEKVEKQLEIDLPRTFSEGFFADAAVLVEGDTDRVILDSIAERLGYPLDAHGVAVIPVNGKNNLRLASCLLEQLGTPTFVVVDGDAEGWTRKPAARQANAKASHQAATDRVLTWLPTTPVQHGSEPTSFGDSTAVSVRALYFYDDLEHELASWTGFVDELAARGESDLRTKNTGLYRSVATVAALDSLPGVFATAVNAMIALSA